MLRTAASYPAKHRNQRCWQELNKKEFKQFKQFKQFKEGSQEPESGSQEALGWRHISGRSAVSLNEVVTGQMAVIFGFGFHLRY